MFARLGGQGDGQGGIVGIGAGQGVVCLARLLQRHLCLGQGLLCRPKLGPGGKGSLPGGKGFGPDHRGHRLDRVGRRSVGQGPRERRQEGGLRVGGVHLGLHRVQRHQGLLFGGLQPFDLGLGGLLVRGPRILTRGQAVGAQVERAKLHALSRLQLDQGGVAGGGQVGDKKVMAARGRGGERHLARQLCAFGIDGDGGDPAGGGNRLGKGRKGGRRKQKGKKRTHGKGLVLGNAGGKVGLRGLALQGGKPAPAWGRNSGLRAKITGISRVKAGLSC